MPATPYPVSGYCYDSDGTTALANVRVDVRNSTQNTSRSTTTNSSGQYIVDLANLASGYADADSISIFASYGRYYDEEIFSVDVSIGSKEQNLTIETLLPTAAQYCSVQNIRDYTMTTIVEFSDRAVSDMINRVTATIDEETGRTWKGIQTKTNEYYDGDGTLQLVLNNTDIQSITAVAIDDSASGTYTALTVADDIHLYNEGYLIINTINASITNWAVGYKTCRISYTWGNAMPTEDVRRLAILMVANEIHLEQNRSDEINKLMNHLKWKVQAKPI